MLFGRVFQKLRPLKYRCLGDWASGGRRTGGRAGGRPKLTLFQSYMLTLILQWIAFIFGRDEEEDQ